MLNTGLALGNLGLDGFLLLGCLMLLLELQKLLDVQRLGNYRLSSCRPQQEETALKNLRDQLDQA